MWNDLKAFILRGNVLDLAVGVIIGAAFGAVVKSAVDDLIMPPIGLITGGLDFSNQFILLKAGTKGAPQPYTTAAAAHADGAITLNYGSFLSATLTFLIVAVVVFLLVRAVNKLYHRPTPLTPDTKKCPFCTMPIPLEATRCPQCTSDLAAVGGGALPAPAGGVRA